MSTKCYEQIQNCIATNSSIQRLLKALAEFGCPFDLRRHVVCENDDEGHYQHHRAGFDRKHCQIVLFSNRLHSTKEFCTIFQHELIHAFDYCRADLNFENLEHLACTEIRAANLSDQCSFFQHLSTSSRPFRWKNQHQQCVKERARESMKISFDRTRKELDEIIENVFSRCYHDREPFDDE